MVRLIKAWGVASRWHKDRLKGKKINSVHVIGDLLFFISLKHMLLKAHNEFGKVIKGASIVAFMRMIEMRPVLHMYIIFQQVIQPTPLLAFRRKNQPMTTKGGKCSKRFQGIWLAWVKFNSSMIK